MKQTTITILLISQVQVSVNDFSKNLVHFTDSYEGWRNSLEQQQDNLQEYDNSSSSYEQC